MPYAVKTPEATGSWFPLPHHTLIKEVENQLLQTGFLIEAETHALAKDGDRYFGMFQVRLPSRTREDFHHIVGLRNSHDKTFPAGMVAGSRVTICDNLLFSGVVHLSRKHTRYAWRDLQNLTARAIGKLSGSLRTLDDRIDGYMRHALTDSGAHDILVRCVDADAIPVTALKPVLKEWRSPRHAEFEERTAWSLVNAVTEAAYKGKNPATNIKRGQVLHGIFDSLVLAG